MENSRDRACMLDTAPLDFFARHVTTLGGWSSTALESPSTGSRAPQCVQSDGIRSTLAEGGQRFGGDTSKSVRDRGGAHHCECAGTHHLPHVGVGGLSEDS